MAPACCATFNVSCDGAQTDCLGVEALEAYLKSRGSCPPAFSAKRLSILSRGPEACRQGYPSHRSNYMSYHGRAYDIIFRVGRAIVTRKGPLKLGESYVVITRAHLLAERSSRRSASSKAIAELCAGKYAMGESGTVFGLSMWQALETGLAKDGEIEELLPEVRMREDAKEYNVFVHRMLLTVFKGGPKHVDDECDHILARKDGGKTLLENLQWISRSDHEKKTAGEATARAQAAAAQAAAAQAASQPAGQAAAQPAAQPAAQAAASTSSEEVAAVVPATPTTVGAAKRVISKREALALEKQAKVAKQPSVADLFKRRNNSSM